MPYKFIDLCIGLISGCTVAYGVTRWVPQDWNMFPGMLAGGVSGMLIQIFLLLIFMPFFGPFEVMIPVSIICMTVGMLSGMAVTQTALSVAHIISAGGFIGLGVAFMVDRSNRKHIGIN